jgi:hypothetical protein
MAVNRKKTSSAIFAWLSMAWVGSNIRLSIAKGIGKCAQKLSMAGISEGGVYQIHRRPLDGPRNSSSY